MKLPNTIISLIFNEIEEKEWSKLYFLFMDEIEWKIYNLNDIIDNKELREKCKNENIFTILKNKNNKLNWNEWKLCEGGNLNIVNLMIKCGKNDWNYGLEGACYGGHLNIVKLMIKKGANCWNRGLVFACWCGHSEIVYLMIKKGAKYCNYCHKSINDHLIKK